MKTLKNLEEIMTKSLITIRPDATLNEALDFFEENSIHHLLVTDGKEGKLLGILSKQDLLHVFLSLRDQSDPISLPDIDQILIRDAMTEDPLFLDPSDSIGLAADIFLSNKFHSLPIVEDGILLGIVTSHDLLRFAFENVNSEGNREFKEI